MEILVCIGLIVVITTTIALIVGAGIINEALKELEEEDDRFFN